MCSNGNLVRTLVLRVVSEETEWVNRQGLTPTVLHTRQLRMTEAELAHRLRSGFPDLDTFLNAQGKHGDRDIVSDPRDLEVEVKYFCTQVPQGGLTPLSDWRWLLGLDQRQPNRGFQRLIVSFFPLAQVGFVIQNRPFDRIPGKRIFQDCLSYTASTPEEYRPFLPVVEIVTPMSATTGRPLQPRLSFAERWSPRSVVRWQQDGRNIAVRYDVIGNPYQDPVWAIVHEVVDEVTAGELAAAGYTAMQ